jgi:hypothetical protein
MYRTPTKLLILFACVFSFSNVCGQQSDSAKNMRTFKNIIRYNLSSGLLFGFDKYIVWGYERVVTRNQSFSVNIGRASLPKLVSFETDSFSLSKNQKRGGFNLSFDYRFYLGKENKYPAPRGVYIGPYYSYNHYTSDNQWDYKSGSANSSIKSHTDFNINTIGFELGYQFIFWKRLALDLVLVGPGLGFYSYKATFDSNIDPATKEQLLEGLKQLLSQKFPGMNYVISDKQFSSNGTLRINTIAYRYIIHLGFNF